MSVSWESLANDHILGIAPYEPGKPIEELERELEQIVTRLEQGKVSLDEAIALWERGEELYTACVGRLDSAQGKIEELAKRVESAKPSA